MPEGESNKNQKGGESRNLDSLKNVNLDAISSSLNEASAEINEKQKELDGLEEQKKKVLEKLNQKISLIKKQTDDAFQKMKNFSWDEALLCWNKVLEIDPENEEAKKGLTECQAQKEAAPKTPVAATSSPGTLNQEDLDKLLSEGRAASGIGGVMSQEELDKLLFSGGLTPSSEPAKEAPVSPSEEKPSETLSQEELDKLIFGDNPPPKTDSGKLTVDKGKEPSSLTPEAHADKPMSQDELDAMLNNFSKEGIPEIYSQSGKETKNEGSKKEPQEPEMLSQNQIDALLGIATPASEPSADLSGEMMTQEELDKFLNPSPAAVPAKETVSPQTKEPPSEPPKAEQSTPAEVWKLNTNDADLFQLGSALSSLAYIVPIKNIVEDPLSELHPPENIHYAEVMDDSKNIDEVFKEMATSTGLDLNEVSKMGDTIAANVSQEMKSIPLEMTTEGAESPVSESVALAARKTKPGLTEILSDVKMVKDSGGSLKFFYVLKWLVVVLGFGFVCTLTSTLILYSRLTDSVRGKPVIKTEVSSDAIIEAILTEGNKYLEEGEYQKAWDILFSISDQYPSTSSMINNFYKAADLFNDKCKNREDLVQEDYLKISRLYEQIVDQFQGSNKTERASYLAAENYYMAGIYHKSYEMYFRIVSRNPESDYYQSALLQCAKILLIENKFKEARDAYLKVVQEFPDTAAARMSQLDIAKTYQLEALNIKNQFHFSEKR